MQVIERLAPTDGNCRPCINRIGFRGISIHNTSNYSNRANALAHANLLCNGWKFRFVSWHYVVDENYAVRCVPENEVAWCQGDGANGEGNLKTISIEICDNVDGDIRRATDNAVELAADILRRNGVKNARDFLFQHNYWTGKDCPYDIRRNNPYDWNTFVNKVQEKLGTPSQKGADQILYKGSKVKFDGVFKVDILKSPISTNLFGCTKLTGISFNQYYKEECQSYHWIPLADFTEVNENGSVEGQDDIVYGGISYVKNDHIYEVKDIDVPTDSAKLNINGRDVWVFSKYLLEVEDSPKE